MDNKNKNKNKNKNLYSDKLIEIDILIKKYEENYYSKKYTDSLDNLKMIVMLTNNTNKKSKYYTYMQKLYAKYMRELGDLYQKLQLFDKAIHCYKNVLEIETDKTIIEIINRQLCICDFEKLD